MGRVLNLSQSREFFKILAVRNDANADNGQLFFHPSTNPPLLIK